MRRSRDAEEVGWRRCRSTSAWAGHTRRRHPITTRLEQAKGILGHDGRLDMAAAFTALRARRNYSFIAAASRAARCCRMPMVATSARAWAARRSGSASFPRVRRGTGSNAPMVPVAVRIDTAGTDR